MQSGSCIYTASTTGLEPVYILSAYDQAALIDTVSGSDTCNRSRTAARQTPGQD